MKKITTSFTSVALVASLSACASQPKDIPAAYVSPITYETYSCEQLGQEAQRISARAAEVTGAQKKKANNDAVATGVALGLFWPALCLIKGKGGATESEVARMKGEMEAIEQASIQKNCGISFQRA